MSGARLAHVTGVVPHSNVVMATLEPYKYMEESTKVFFLKPGKLCTRNLKVHIPWVHHAPDEIVHLVPSLLHGLRMATMLERLDGIGPLRWEYFHPVYRAIRSCGQCANRVPL